LKRLPAPGVSGPAGEMEEGQEYHQKKQGREDEEPVREAESKLLSGAKTHGQTAMEQMGSLNLSKSEKQVDLRRASDIPIFWLCLISGTFRLAVLQSSRCAARLCDRLPIRFVTRTAHPRVPCRRFRCPSRTGRPRTQGATGARRRGRRRQARVQAGFPPRLALSPFPCGTHAWPIRCRRTAPPSRS